MAKVEEVAIKIKLVYNDDKTHRYPLTKIWDSYDTICKKIRKINTED